MTVMPYFDEEILTDLTPFFRRGDANSDGTVDLSDSTKILAYLFLGDDEPGCMEAANANDDRSVDLSDAMTVMAYLFLGETNIARPGPQGCGFDPTESLSCDASTACD